ncbi:MAG TPA: FKBP-type peptidyl-prolyl cis-trans isomerase [Thermoanaerobaculia bacterium]|nr:FKBP-type peptidyl-prolyl cis-trans isomerase [Thermoanaerobaculia bacterium]
MKKFLTLSAALLVAVAGAAHGQSGKPAQKPAAPAAQPAPAAPPSAAPSGKPESLQDKASYTIGLNLGKSLKTNDIQANIDLIVKGLRDGLGGGQSLLTDEEMQTTMQTLQQQVSAQQEAKRKALGEKNKAEGEAYLAKNKERPGVKTTASGLQYEVLSEGTGPMPKPTDSVTVNYKGTLMDGSVFDSSYDRKEPVTFVLNQVIPGWTEGVQLMKVGSKYKFYIPSALGYGERGAGNTIGPNSPLIFEVELISIGAPAAAPGGEAKPQAETPKPTTTPKPAQKPADKKPPV